MQSWNCEIAVAHTLGSNDHSLAAYFEHSHRPARVAGCSIVREILAGILHTACTAAPDRMTGLLAEKGWHQERERCHAHLLVCSYSGSDVIDCHLVLLSRLPTIRVQTLWEDEVDLRTADA